MHGFDDAVRGVDVANLVAQAHNAPFAGGFVDGFGDVGVKGGALAQDVVEREAADFGAHGCLGELGNGVFGVFDAVAGRKRMNFSVYFECTWILEDGSWSIPSFVSVEDTSVEYTIQV